MKHPSSSNLKPPAGLFSDYFFWYGLWYLCCPDLLKFLCFDFWFKIYAVRVYLWVYNQVLSSTKTIAFFIFLYCEQFTIIHWVFFNCVFTIHTVFFHEPNLPIWRFSPHYFNDCRFLLLAPRPFCLPLLSSVAYPPSTAISVSSLFRHLRPYCSLLVTDS